MENIDLQNVEKLVTGRTEQLRQAISALERSYDITLESLGNALSLKDPHTEHHCKRVTAFSISIARALGQAADQIRVTARGAFLHDIGHLATPSVILRKPNTLTSDEVKIMRTHCIHGYDLVRKIPFLAEPAEIIYAHHERLDGTGYPRGLKGEEIPLGARIVSVADAFDVITSGTPYRKAQSVQAARNEIEHWSSNQFEPRVVEAFLRIPDREWQELRDGIDAGRQLQQ